MLKPTPTWSPERDAIVVRDYPDDPVGVPTLELLDRLNALPGRTVTASELIARARRLGVQRSQRFRNEANRRFFAAGHEARRKPVPAFVPKMTVPVFVENPKRPVVRAARPQRAPDPRPYAGLLAHRTGGGFSMLRPR